METNALSADREEPAFVRELLEQLNGPDLAIFAVVALAVTLMLIVARRFIDRSDQTQQFGRQLTMLGLTLVGAGAIVLALPVQDSLIQALLGMIGLLFSAVIALSATTFMGNAMAGFMLRSLRSFKAGDFIRCGEHFGRVTERGLIHTEIQTEDSDLTTLPNLFLVTNPLTTVRSTGTTVSATVSLDYGVPRAEIEAALLKAAEATGLNDPFVQILDLGDFSVIYRLAGFSGEVKQLLTLRSRLRASMMDELHAAGIEIVSPTFMQQRVITGSVIPEDPDDTSRSAVKSAMPDRKVFDKADAAETYEFVVAQRAELQDEIKELDKRSRAAGKPDQAKRLQERKRVLERRLAKFDKIIDEHEKARVDE